MKALYIILGILLFLFALTLINIRIYINYNNKLDVKVKYFIFTILKNTDDKKKKKSEKTKEKPKQKPKEEKKEDSFIKKLYNQRGVSGLINILSYLVNTSVKAVKMILKHLNVKELNISVVIADEDAAQTAVKYGKTCAAVYPLSGALISMLKCKKYNVSVAPDFNAKESSTNCFVYAKIRPLFIIAAALKFTGFLKIIIQTTKEAQSAQDENENDEINIDKNTERKE